MMIDYHHDPPWSSLIDVQSSILIIFLSKNASPLMEGVSTPIVFELGAGKWRNLLEKSMGKVQLFEDVLCFSMKDWGTFSS